MTIENKVKKLEEEIERLKTEKDDLGLSFNKLHSDKKLLERLLEKELEENKFHKEIIKKLIG
jgi:cell division protein FtsL